MGGRAEDIIIMLGRCKGCGICVEFCPKDVLEMKDGKAFVARLDDCIACNLCDLRCPDFAIEVVPKARPSRDEAAKVETTA